MKEPFNYIFAALFVFAHIGGIGYLFDGGIPVFGTALTLEGIWSGIMLYRQIFKKKS